MDSETLKRLRTELDDYLAEFDDCFRSDQSRGHLGVYATISPLRGSTALAGLRARARPWDHRELAS